MFRPKACINVRQALQTGDILYKIELIGWFSLTSVQMFQQISSIYHGESNSQQNALVTVSFQYIKSFQ